MDNSITKITSLGEEETLLQEFSIEQQEQAKIDSSNSKAVFSPEFVPFYFGVQKKYGLTQTETLIYGFIRFYTSIGTHQFYFTNEQIAEVVGCNEQTAKRAISTLRKHKLFDFKQKVRSGGGTIRFINPTGTIPTQGVQNAPVRQVQFTPPNNNKIKENKKKEKYKKEKLFLFLSLFNSLFGSKYTATDGRRKKLGARLKAFSFEQILEATRNLAASPFHQGKNDRSWKADPDFLLRSDEQIDKWLNQKPEVAARPKRYIELKGSK